MEVENKTFLTIKIIYQKHMDNKLLICLAIVVAVVAILYCITKKQNEGYGYEYGLTAVTPRSDNIPDIEFIRDGATTQYESPDGVEIIPPGDLSTWPSYGIGEGTVGFGRYGGSWMV